ncbi:hypothetical protein ACFOGJ_08950 [Marinibaculum pumilum]|uniref:DUF1376 domain-containing protein n=1 Tax=Marinibaculum pumilum TaxID=1766165 RepID=A0ABV7KYW6_9PROT
MATGPSRFDWFRSHHGAPTDPKWQMIARRAGVRPGDVAAVWWALMDFASQHEDRGSIDGFDPEELAAAYGYEEDEVAKILAALEGKGLIADGRLTAWDKRQTKRDDDSAERVRAHRERKRQAAQKGNGTVPDDTSEGSDETDGNADATAGNERVTRCNAPDREVEEEEDKDSPGEVCAQPPAPARDPDPPDNDGKAIVFSGRFIRLNRGDFDTWAESYHAIPDLKAELRAIDDWIAAQPAEKRSRKWFYSVSQMLLRKHQEILAQRQAEAKAEAEEIPWWRRLDERPAWADPPPKRDDADSVH